jgi:hypothetical protein
MKDRKGNYREMLYRRKEGRATGKEINEALNELWTINRLNLEDASVDEKRGNQDFLFQKS